MENSSHVSKEMYIYEKRDRKQSYDQEAKEG
jgi:hypothetical protein